MDSQTDVPDVATTSGLNTKHKSSSRKKMTENGNKVKETTKTSAGETKSMAQRKKIMKFRNFQIDEEDPRKAAWTIREKTALLKALRKHGWKKIDKIAAEMPTKTREQIEYFMDTKKRQTRYLLAAQTGSTKFPIELWLEKAKRLMARKPNYSKALPEALGLISKFENHDAVFGPNCESLYGFFQGLLNGEPPKELNAFESKIVLHLIKVLAAILRRLPLEEITKEVTIPASLIKRNELTRTYSNENMEDLNGEASVSNQELNNSVSQYHVKSPKDYVADLYDDIDHSSDLIQDENIPVSEASRINNSSSTSIHVNSECSPLKSIPHHSRETEEEPKSLELFSINPLSIPINLLKKTYLLASNIPVFEV